MSKSASAIREDIDAAIDGLKSLHALGLWTRMRPWFESSSHDGHLEIDGLAGTLDRLARKLHRTPDQLSRPLAALQRKQLVSISTHGVITSELMKRLTIALRRNAEKQSRHRKREIGGYVTPIRGVTQGVTQGVTAPPALSPSPTPPTSIPPTPEIPSPSGTGGVAAGRRKRRGKGESVPGHQAAVAAWLSAWSASHHDGRYPFDDRDGAAIDKILSVFGAKSDVTRALGRFDKLTRTYLGTPPPSHIYHGHPLYRLRENLPEWIDKTAQAEKGLTAEPQRKNGHPKGNDKHADVMAALANRRPE